MFNIPTPETSDILLFSTSKNPGSISDEKFVAKLLFSTETHVLMRIYFEIIKFNLQQVRMARWCSDLTPGFNSWRGCEICFAFIFFFELDIIVKVINCLFFYEFAYVSKIFNHVCINISLVKIYPCIFLLKSVCRPKISHKSYPRLLFFLIHIHIHSAGFVNYNI